MSWNVSSATMTAFPAHWTVITERYESIDPDLMTYCLSDV